MQNFTTTLASQLYQSVPMIKYDPIGFDFTDLKNPEHRDEL